MVGAADSEQVGWGMGDIPDHLITKAEWAPEAMEVAGVTHNLEDIPEGWVCQWEGGFQEDIHHQEEADQEEAGYPTCMEDDLQWTPCRIHIWEVDPPCVGVAGTFSVTLETDGQESHKTTDWPLIGVCPS